MKTMTLTIILFGCCSCAPNTKYDIFNEYENYILMVRGATCSKQLDTKCVLVSDLLTNLGQPEITMKMSELPELLSNEGEYTSDIEYIMKNMYRGYLVYLREDSDRSLWRSSEDFLNLDVLIYHYSDGPDVSICGLWCKDTGLISPFYFVTDGIKVLYIDRILHPKYIKNSKER